MEKKANVTSRLSNEENKYHPENVLIYQTKWFILLANKIIWQSVFDDMVSIFYAYRGCSIIKSYYIRDMAQLHCTCLSIVRS